MKKIKITTQVDEDVWNELESFARESQQDISGLLTEVIREYIQRNWIKPDEASHLEASMDKNEGPGKLLAK